jgi:hypothetical protein
VTTSVANQDVREPDRGPVAELFHREPVYAAAALCFALAMLPTAFAMVVDQRTFQGVNVWIKPLKFEFSICIYLATLAWFAGWLPRGTTSSPWYRVHAGLVVFAAVAEIVWISGAAAFGIASHFNVTHPFLAKVYPVMGAFAVLLTSATIPYGFLIWRNSDGPLTSVVRLSLGLGLLLTFVLTVATAGFMSGQFSHLVGSSGATQPGLPVMGWSRTAGDLRVAHFFATHAMHLLPAVGFLASCILQARVARGAVIGSGMLYTAFVAFTLFQAALGQPFRVFGL